MFCYRYPIKILYKLNSHHMSNELYCTHSWSQQGNLIWARPRSTGPKTIKAPTASRCHQLAPSYSKQWNRSKQFTAPHSPRLHVIPCRTQPSSNAPSVRNKLATQPINTLTSQVSTMARLHLQIVGPVRLRAHHADSLSGAGSH